MRSLHVSAMQSDQHDSEWYRPDPVTLAPEDLVVLMELAGIEIRILDTGPVYIKVKGTDFAVPRDEDGSWQRNAYEIWQHVTTKGRYGSVV